jgi:hypothetical protein
LPIKTASASALSKSPLEPYAFARRAFDPKTAIMSQQFLYVQFKSHLKELLPALPVVRQLRLNSRLSMLPIGSGKLPVGILLTKKSLSGRRRNLIFTRGVYHLDRTIEVKRPDTVVLGLGIPTLVPDNGVVATANASRRSFGWLLAIECVPNNWLSVQSIAVKAAH